MLAQKLSHVALLLTILGIAGSVQAAPPRVVTTGDSHTVRYGSSLLSDSLTANGFSAQVLSVSAGACNSRVYVGQETTVYTPVATNFTDGVLASDPDVIVFQLGTNDAWMGRNASDCYISDISGVFDIFQGYVNGRGQHPRLIICTALPIMDYYPEGVVANANLDSQYNLWLRDQADDRGIQLLDLNQLIRQQAGWQTWYDSYGIHIDKDGDHYTWMADEVAQAIIAPEPCMLGLICVGVVALLKPRR